MVDLFSASQPARFIQSNEHTKWLGVASWHLDMSDLWAAGAALPDGPITCCASAQTQKKSVAPFVNPHQKREYSNSPFARKDTFLYCRVQKWVGGGCQPGTSNTKNEFAPRKISYVVIGTYVTVRTSSRVKKLFQILWNR